MAVTAQTPGQLGDALLDALIAANPVKVLLTDATWVFDPDTHRFRSSVTGEVAATGYTAGGQAVTGLTTTYNSANNTTTLDFDDVVWTANITARRAVFYVSTGTATSDVLLAVWTSDVDVTSANGGTFTLTPNAAGLLAVAA